MADSDDEYEFDGGSRKRHNKFRNERDDLNDYGNGNGGGGAMNESRYSSISSMIVSPAANNKRHGSREPGNGDVYRGPPSRSYDSNPNYRNDRPMGARGYQQPGGDMRRGGGMPRYNNNNGARFDNSYNRGGGGGDRYDYGGMGYNKRSFNGMPHHGGQASYYGGGAGLLSDPLDYDEFPPQKKSRQDWSSVLDDPTYSSYYEHDNRSAAPDYDEFDGYNDDYTRLTRPSNYSSSNAQDKPDYRGQQYQSAGGYSESGPKRFQNNNNNNFYSGGYRQMYGQYDNYNNPMPQQQPQQYGGYNKYGGNYQNNRMNANYGTQTPNTELDGESQPQMMSFKQFLATLNSEAKETVTAEVATLKYTEYKNNFRRDQIAKFFSAHKLEDWFKCRYHPKISTKRKEEQRETIKHRLDLYMALLERYGNDQERPLSLDMTDEANCTWLYKFLDAAMIKLEGGSEQDLELLEELYHMEANREAEQDTDRTLLLEEVKSKSNMSDKESGVGSDDETKEDKKPDEEEKQEAGEIRGEVVEGDGQLDVQVEAVVIEQEKEAVREELEKAKEADETSAVSEAKAKIASLADRLANVNKLHEHLQKLNKISASIPQKTQSIFFKHLPVIVTRQDLEEIGKKYEGFKRASISEPAPERRFQRRGWITFDSKINIRDTCARINGTKLYDMMLHVTVNRELDNKIKCVTGLINHKIAIRHDLKLITKVVRNMDKRWGLWEFGDDYETRDKKEEPEVVVADKEESSAAVMDTDEAASEVKATDEGEAVESKPDEVAKPVVEDPVEVAAKLEFAARYNELYNGKSNPLLGAALDYLKSVEESESRAKEPADENDSEAKPASPEVLSMEKDPEGARLLDRLILYLRLVHSIDFYNVTEYPQEDYMPNRCGALHVRASSELRNNNFIVSVVNSASVNYYDPSAIKKSQLDEWTRLFDMNIRSYADYHERIDDELAKKLGLKDLKAEVDKFVATNCQKVDKDIWLCPLSGKKFKGPDYVRKHIESKHADKLAEVAEEVDYFNRFVLDPKRPYLPEHPLNRNQYGQPNWQNGGNYNNGNNMDYRMNQGGGGYYQQNRNYYGGYQDYGYNNSQYNSYQNQSAGYAGHYNQNNRFNGRPARRY